MSVKDQWVGPHKQVLNVPIVCWWYGPSKPSSWPSIDEWFFPTVSMVVLGEKLGTDLRISQSTWCGLCWEPFFSGVVALLHSVDDYMKDCYALITWDMHGLGPYADGAWMRVACWSGFSCRVYINSNCRGSRIWVTACLNMELLCFTIITYLQLLLD
jgi:hypothetical protein